MECILRKSGRYINRQEGRIPFSSFAFFLSRLPPATSSIFFLLLRRFLDDRPYFSTADVLVFSPFAKRML